jgi:hypothetical protein
MRVINDIFNPDNLREQIIQAKSLSRVYELSTYEYNKTLKYVISESSVNNLQNTNFYMLYSDDVRIYDIFSEFEDYNIYFEIEYNQEPNLDIKDVTSVKIKNFLYEIGPTVLLIHKS